MFLVRYAPTKSAAPPLSGGGNRATLKFLQTNFMQVLSNGKPPNAEVRPEGAPGAVDSELALRCKNSLAEKPDRRLPGSSR